MIGVNEVIFSDADMLSDSCPLHNWACAVTVHSKHVANFNHSTFRIVVSSLWQMKEV